MTDTTICCIHSRNTSGKVLPRPVWDHFQSQLWTHTRPETLETC